MPTAASTRNKNVFCHYDVGIDIPAAPMRRTCVLCKVVWSCDTCFC
ncbi:unnamed protein product, partial [Ectocarpus sp. 6 AP-2014]